MIEGGAHSNGPAHLGASSFSVGKHALGWILGHADVWYLLFKFTAYVGRYGGGASRSGSAPSPVTSTLSVLENLLMLEEDHSGVAEDQEAENLENLEEEEEDGERHMQQIRRIATRNRAETLPNAGSLSLSPPPQPPPQLSLSPHQNQPGHNQHHQIGVSSGGSSTVQVVQPASAPGSPPPPPVPLTVLGSPLCSNGGRISPATQGDPTATLDPNWQATKSTVRERNAAMFNNDLMADIRFLVGTPGSTQLIPAHKYVLATGSSVFYAMFYGGLAECTEEIEVPDVEPSAFLTLLKYLYCDEIQLEADTVLATLYVAKKYIVPHLARACVQYLETSLTAKNACLLLSQSRLFEEPELMQRCWEVIDAQVSLSLAQRTLSCLELGDDTSIEKDVPIRPPPKRRHFSCGDQMRSTKHDIP